jgi:hypothetical protein
VSLRAVASVTAATAATPQWDPAGFAVGQATGQPWRGAPGTEPHARHADVEFGENPLPSGTRVHALPAAPARAGG